MPHAECSCSEVAVGAMRVITGIRELQFEHRRCVSINANHWDVRLADRKLQKLPSDSAASATTCTACHVTADFLNRMQSTFTISAASATSSGD